MKKLLLLLLLPSLSFADHSWGNYHWINGEVRVIESLTTDFSDELAEAVWKWNDSEVLNITVEAVQNDEASRANCLMTAGFVRVCNYNYGETGWLGLATVGVDSSGHVDRAVSRVNMYYNYWGSQYWRNKIVCHEVGHTFGLGHTSTDGSSQGTCMDYSSSSASEWPNEHDYEQLLTIYNHTHNEEPEPPKPTKCKGNDKDCDGIPDKGKKGRNKGILVSSDKNHQIWVTPRSNGRYWITHIWLV